MTSKTSDFLISIATVNGSGSQTANNILLRSLFRMGMPVGGKNVFPSNISGMPTWFWIRSNQNGFLGAKSWANIVLAFNAQTFESDQKLLKPGSFFFYPEEMALLKKVRNDIVSIPLPFKSLSDQIKAPPKIKKMAANMIYVGILAELLKIPKELIQEVLQDQLRNKPSVIEPNLAALEIGRTYSQEKLNSLDWPYQSKLQEKPIDKILMDGNTAAALGLLAGGCQFISWYPITPSTSLVETFSRFANKTRKDEQNKNKFALVQAEDEISAFSMVMGAGWAGARSMTATSGPGLSLMAEGAGYAYYAEIPSVIWNVQRLGPSTGLPTRTAQGDITFSAHLSHGDAKHVLLIPSNLEECFEFGQTCFDLAERLQQLVIVLSDLDLGMNLSISPLLRSDSKEYDRGKVLTSEELDNLKKFNRYEDIDGDGICSRTLPGNSHPLAAYFTRGSGHNAQAQYSEKANEYSENMIRLERKWETAKTIVPSPIIRSNSNENGILYYGSTLAIAEELDFLMAEKNIKFDHCRLRAYPFSKSVEEFLKEHQNIYIIEQNHDGQMRTLLSQAFPQWASRFKSILHFDGTPITADSVRDKILEIYSGDVL